MKREKMQVEKMDKTRQRG